MIFSEAPIYGEFKGWMQSTYLSLKRRSVVDEIQVTTIFPGNAEGPDVGMVTERRFAA